jgi:hypothetical protein
LGDDQFPAQHFLDFNRCPMPHLRLGFAISVMLNQVSEQGDSASMHCSGEPQTLARRRRWWRSRFMLNCNRLPRVLLHMPQQKQWLLQQL